MTSSDKFNKIIDFISQYDNDQLRNEFNEVTTIKLKVKCKSPFSTQTNYAFCEWVEGDIEYFIYYPMSGYYFTDDMFEMPINREDFKDNFVIIKVIRT